MYWKGLLTVIVLINGLAGFIIKFNFLLAIGNADWISLSLIETWLIVATALAGAHMLSCIFHYWRHKTVKQGNINVLDHSLKYSFAASSAHVVGLHFHHMYKQHGLEQTNDKNYESAKSSFIHAAMAVSHFFIDLTVLLLIVFYRKNYDAINESVESQLRFGIIAAFVGSVYFSQWIMFVTSIFTIVATGNHVSWIGFRKLIASGSGTAEDTEVSEQYVENEMMKESSGKAAVVEHRSQQQPHPNYIPARTNNYPGNGSACSIASGFPRVNL